MNMDRQDVQDDFKSRILKIAINGFKTFGWLATEEAAETRLAIASGVTVRRTVLLWGHSLITSAFSQHRLVSYSPDH